MYVELASHSPDKKPYSSIIATSATSLNIFLATGIFSLPYAIYRGGILLTLLIYAICAVFSYISLDILIGNMEQTCSKLHTDGNCPIQSHPSDSTIQQSPSFINRKTEMSLMLNTFTNTPWKVVFLIVYTIYCIGSLWVKTVVATLSLQRAISYLIYDDLYVLDKNWGFNTYYLFLAIFIAASIAASIGNVENSKFLQVFIILLRFLTVILMLIATEYSLYKYGSAKAKDIVFWDTDQVFLVLGNVVMINLLQHTLPGILYPMRPQIYYRKTILANIGIGAFVLLLEGICGVMAFASYKGIQCNEFPCEISQVYNLNFLHFPVIGYIINFYPLCNIAAIATISISLRNNIMQMMNYDMSKDSTTMKTKLLWTLLIVFPVVVLSCVYDQPETIITYTANYTGTVIMFLMPTVICYYVLKGSNAENTNRFYKKQWCILLWVWLAIVWALNTIEKIYDAAKHK